MGVRWWTVGGWAGGSLAALYNIYGDEKWVNDGMGGMKKVQLLEYTYKCSPLYLDVSLARMWCSSLVP